MPTTLGSATYFWASVWAGDGPCSTGVSPCRSWIFRPICGASVLTAYLAQESCSWPRNAAPPVSGVTIAILSVFEQLRPPAAALEDDELAATAGTAPSVTAVIAEIAAAPAIAESLGVDLEIFMNHSFVEERGRAHT